ARGRVAHACGAHAPRAGSAPIAGTGQNQSRNRRSAGAERQNRRSPRQQYPGQIGRFFAGGSDQSRLSIRPRLIVLSPIHRGRRGVRTHMSNLAVLRSRLATAAGIGLLAVIGGVHLLYAHGYYLFVPYVGVLFYATVAGAAIVAVGLVRGARVWGWT